MEEGFSGEVVSGDGAVSNPTWEADTEGLQFDTSLGHITKPNLQ